MLTIYQQIPLLNQNFKDQRTSRHLDLLKYIGGTLLISQAHLLPFMYTLCQMSRIYKQLLTANLTKIMCRIMCIIISLFASRFTGVTRKHNRYSQNQFAKQRWNNVRYRFVRNGYSIFYNNFQHLLRFVEVCTIPYAYSHNSRWYLQGGQFS